MTFKGAFAVDVEGVKGSLCALPRAYTLHWKLNALLSLKETFHGLRAFFTIGKGVGANILSQMDKSKIEEIQAYLAIMALTERWENLFRWWVLSMHIRSKTYKPYKVKRYMKLKVNRIISTKLGYTKNIFSYIWYMNKFTQEKLTFYIIKKWQTWKKC